jgi:hypothetical protein
MKFKNFLEQFYGNEMLGPNMPVVPIYLNPTISEITNLGANIRGIVDGNRIFVWNENFATHNYVANILNLNKKDGFYLHRIGSKYEVSLSGYESLQKLFLHPQIKRLYSILYSYDKNGDRSDPVDNFDQLYKKQELRMQPQMS